MMVRDGAFKTVRNLHGEALIIFNSFLTHGCDALLNMSFASAEILVPYFARIAKQTSSINFLKKMI